MYFPCTFLIQISSFYFILVFKKKMTLISVTWKSRRFVLFYNWNSRERERIKEAGILNIALGALFIFARKSRDDGCIDYFVSGVRFDHD